MFGGLGDDKLTGSFSFTGSSREGKFYSRERRQPKSQKKGPRPKEPGQRRQKK